MTEDKVYNDIHQFIGEIDRVFSDPGISRGKLVVHKSLLLHRKKPRWYIFWPKFFRLKWMRRRNVISDAVKHMASYYDMEIVISEPIR